MNDVGLVIKDGGGGDAAGQEEEEENLDYVVEDLSNLMKSMLYK